MENLFEQKQVEELAEKVLGKIKEDIKNDIADKFYNEMSNYLYEHYTNAEDKIKDDLISKITEEFVKNPSDYKFKRLRQKLFEENKEELVGLLTDEQIFKSVEKIIWDYTLKEHGFRWKWEEAVGRFVIKNIDSFKDNERIQNMFARELANKNEWIKHLEQKIREIQSISND